MVICIVLRFLNNNCPQYTFDYELTLIDIFKSDNKSFSSFIKAVLTVWLVLRVKMRSRIFTLISVKEKHVHFNAEILF